MLRILDRALKPKSEYELRELKIDSECRLRHFRYLSEQNLNPCLSFESSSKCTLRWAVVFGRSGGWDQMTREFFFGKMLESWQKDHDPDTLVSYVLKDQELFHLSSLEMEKERQDRLSGTIFEKVGQIMKESEAISKPQPYHFKFKESYSEYLSRSRG
ncbi:MAG: hypothetical protein KGP28_04195 [Bdellovibrionales bacterium]|nr:hypothetical protein [Bdellovibrionales bacterium]